MPAKGKFYSHIDIACDRWAKDWLAKTGKRPADLARLLGVANRFVHHLVYGRINTMKTLEIIVQKAGGGNYMTMGHYATTKEGLESLKEMQFWKKLSPLEREQYGQLRGLALRCKKKHGNLDRMLKLCEDEIDKPRNDKE